MSETTAIAWTEKTWNPWHGCSKVSPGCAHCYMFRDKIRYGQNPELVVKSKTKFRDPLKWKEPALVFTCSWSDWFHEAADGWRDEAWAIVKATPHLTYQILTKRPERIMAHLPWGEYGDPWPNVWLGVSVENQRWARRVSILQTVPAALRFVSAEPLLGPVRLYEFMPPHGSLAWVIAGGESGPKARPCKEEWLCTIRDDCHSHGIPFFLKQLGGRTDARAHDKAIIEGQTYTDIPVRA